MWNIVSVTKTAKTKQMGKRGFKAVFVEVTNDLLTASLSRHMSWFLLIFLLCYAQPSRSSPTFLSWTTPLLYTQILLQGTKWKPSMLAPELSPQTKLFLLDSILDTKSFSSEVSSWLLASCSVTVQLSSLLSSITDCQVPSVYTEISVLLLRPLKCFQLWHLHDFLLG